MGDFPQDMYERYLDIVFSAGRVDERLSALAECARLRCGDAEDGGFAQPLFCPIPVVFTPAETAASLRALLQCRTMDAVSREAVTSHWQQFRYYGQVSQRSASDIARLFDRWCRWAA